MPAGKLNIYIEQGSTFRLAVTWRDPAGNPYNLSGASARMAIREKHGMPVLISATSATGEITLGAELGTIEVKLPATLTDTLAIKNGVYDLEVEFPTGDVARVIQGKVTVDPSVTR